MTIQLGILLALLCAVVSNLGFFFKHRGACEAPPVDIRHPLRTARALYSSKWFALGMIVATSAWGFHVAALALAPMSVVQVVLAGAPAEHHGVMLGAASGVLFGVSDVAIKALTHVGGMEGVLGVLVSPWLLVTISASVAAFYASARGLQDGDAVPVIAITGTAANISCIAGGIIVFGDPLPGDALGIAIEAVAFVMIIVASALTPAPVRSAGVSPAPVAA